MKKPFTIYEPWDVLVVPFPFVERHVSKRRPALVLSRTHFNREGHLVLAMITTKYHAHWGGDVEIDDYEEAGLSSPCIVRLKLFTLDARLIVKKIGQLSKKDRQKVLDQLRKYMV